jgi:hypothetical protein
MVILRVHPEQTVNISAMPMVIIDFEFSLSRKPIALFVESLASELPFHPKVS